MDASNGKTQQSSYGQPTPEEEPYIYRSQAKDGTCAFYAYATLYAHGSLIFIMVLRIYNALYFIPLYHFSYFYIVLKDLNVTK